MSAACLRRDDGLMESEDRLNTRASELLEEARRFQSAAAQPGCHVDAPDALASLEEALQLLSAAWYQVAADGSPGIVEREALQDVAAAFARCARVCREGRSKVRSIQGNGFPRFDRYDRPGQRVA